VQAGGPLRTAGALHEGVAVVVQGGGGWEQQGLEPRGSAQVGGAEGGQVQLVRVAPATRHCGRPQRSTVDTASLIGLALADTGLVSGLAVVRGRGGGGGTGAQAPV
jgi:hypothetical protein